MPARKNQHVAFNRAHATHYAIGPRANLVWRFPVRADVPVAGLAELSSSELLIRKRNWGLESPQNTQTGMSALRNQTFVLHCESHPIWPSPLTDGFELSVLCLSYNAHLPVLALPALI